MNVFCTQCGKKILENAKYCSHCGSEVPRIENNDLLDEFDRDNHGKDNDENGSELVCAKESSEDILSREESFHQNVMDSVKETKTAEDKDSKEKDDGISVCGGLIPILYMVGYGFYLYGTNKAPNVVLLIGNILLGAIAGGLCAIVCIYVLGLRYYVDEFIKRIILVCCISGIIGGFMFASVAAVMCCGYIVWKGQKIKNHAE